MRKISYLLIYFVITFIVFSEIINAQNIANSVITNKTAWSTNNVFKTDVFMENFGQFDNWVNSSEPVKYAINNSDKIFFTNQSVIFRLEKVEKISEEEREEMERKEGKEAFPKKEIYYVNMQWQGCNPECKIEASEQGESYYTFGEKGYENVRAKGFRKLIYKNLYPNIDAEYTIPDKGGIKYKLLLHPGADVSVIKMQYSGNVEIIKTDSAGNIIITTPAGNITDHAPQSFINETSEIINSSFEFTDNIVSFILNTLSKPTTDNQKPITNNQKPETIIIDPWTTTPTSLTTDNAAYDIDFDDNGNVYVSGGTNPFKLSKYSTTGNYLWTFTNPVNWCNGYIAYSKFCTLHNSGTSFIGEGFNYYSGPKIMKISKSGNLITTSPNYSGHNEIWLMFYNRCSGQLIGFGGGTNYPNNVEIISDTNLTTSNCINFNGFSGYNNDIASVQMDYNGDFYALLSSVLNYNVDNHIMKSLFSANYLPPCAFNVNSGYNFYECYNYGIPGFISASGVTVRANALSLNTTYLYSYDGKTINAWNKSNGNMLGTQIVNALYADGQNRSHEGITVDECNNVYVGGANTVHVYNFNGTSFVPLTPITTNISGEVYDIKFDIISGLLYVCGLNFLTVLQSPIICPTGQLTLTDSTGNCNGWASITASGGTAPYSYHWSNGATTNIVSGLPQGTYYITVTDNSCIPKISIDTVTINNSLNINISNDTTVCSGNTVQLNASGGTSYTWSPAATLNNSNIPNPVANPVTTTTYYVTVSDGTCTNYDSVKITVSPFIINVSNDTSICAGNTVQLYASGGTSYTWSPSATLNNSNIPNPVANPVNTTTYYVTVSDSTCSNYDAVLVEVSSLSKPLPDDTSICFGYGIKLNANNTGCSYLWSTGETSQTIHVNQQGVYTLIITDGNCIVSDTISVEVAGTSSIYFPNAFTPDDNGSNDIFTGKGESIKNYNLKIFTRWGNMIYESDDILKGWDGTYLENDAPTDVYVWVVTYSTACTGNKIFQKFGRVTLLR